MLAAEIAGTVLAFVARLITGAQGHWRGCAPKAEQRIYFANHQSHLDWVLIWAALPQELRAHTRPIAARDYWTRTPLKHWITREVFNAVYVSRTRAAAPAAALAAQASAVGLQGPNTGLLVGATGATGAAGAAGAANAVGAAGAAAAAAAPDLEQDQDPLEPLVQALTAGDSLVIFPEGTRGHASEPALFKSGLYHLAAQFPAVPLVPTWIDNVQRVMPKGEVVPVPLLCTVTFGEPLQLNPGEDKRAFLVRARAAVLAQRPRAA
jgi:1-acyl-sn-glycerol-3-phosphate acyltransferase